MLLKLTRADILLKVKSTGIYLLVPIVNFGFSFFTSPIFARYLTAEEFGYFGYYTSLINFFNIFFSLSFTTYYMSVYYKGTAVERNKTLLTLTSFLLLWNVVFLPAVYFLVMLFFKVSNAQIPFYPFAILTFVAGSVGVYKSFLQIEYRLAGKPLSYFFIVSGYRVLSIMASLYFLANQGMSLKGRMLGSLIVEVLFMGISLIYIYKKGLFTLDKKIIKDAIRVILPLLPASLLYIPVLSFDNIVLERLHQPAEMGLYNIGKGISSYLYVALFPFYQAFEPDIYKHAVNNDIKALRNISTLLVGFVVFSIVCFWVVSPYIIDFLTAGKYNDAVKYANMLVITSGLMIVFSIFDAIINALQETHKHLIINGITMVFCLISYYLGSLYFNQMGVAIASVLTYLFLILLQTIFIVKRYKNQDKLSTNLNLP